jgi:hypothetical protein
MNLEFRDPFRDADAPMDGQSGTPWGHRLPRGGGIAPTFTARVKRYPLVTFLGHSGSAQGCPSRRRPTSRKWTPTDRKAAGSRPSRRQSMEVWRSGWNVLSPSSAPDLTGELIPVTYLNTGLNGRIRRARQVSLCSNRHRIRAEQPEQPAPTHDSKPMPFTGKSPSTFHE